MAVPRLADTGAVDLLVTVIKGDQHAPQAHNQEMRFQQVALRWPADSPPPPEHLRQAWSETDPAKLYHQPLVAGLPVYLPAFGAIPEEQIKDMPPDTGLDPFMPPPRPA